MRDIKEVKFYSHITDYIYRLNVLSLILFVISLRLIFEYNGFLLITTSALIIFTIYLFKKLKRCYFKDKSVKWFVIIAIIVYLVIIFFDITAPDIILP